MRKLNLRLVKKFRPTDCLQCRCTYYFRCVLLLLLIITAKFSISAQAPQKMSYQAVMRNSSGQLLINKTIGLRISILQGSAVGTAVYVETQTATSNANGLVSLQVGDGTVVSGNFSSITWGTNSYYIKTEVDPSGGTAYSITSTTQLLSVPYALYAAGSGSPMVYPGAGIPLSTGSAWGTSITDNSSNWNTAYASRIVSLTTTGSSGAATLSSNTLNIPNYTLAGLGGISLTALSASTPLSYNSATGAFSIQAASGTQGGYLTSANWTSFNNKVGSLGVPSGSNANGGSISSDVLTLSLADATNPGLVSTGTQTFAGSKTFNSASSDPLLITGNGFGTQSGAAAYTQLVVDNTTGAIRKAPSINTLQDVLDNTITTPPGSPSLNDSYIVPSGATGVWSGNTNKIATWNGSAWTYYTPATNDKTTVLTGTNAGYVYIYNGTAWTQVVNASGTSISDLTAAKSTNTIDNKNFAQTWNWSTANTGSGLSLSFNGLTSGTGLSVASLATGLTGNLFYVNTASTGAFTNGGVRFNFNGAHTGNGFQIDDATTTGTAVAINTSGLSSTGTALKVTAAANRRAVSATGDVQATRYLTVAPNTITAAASTTIDLSLGNVFTINFSGSINITTLTMSNASGPETFIIKLTYTGTGNSVTWPASFKWSGNIAPALTNAVGKTDVISVIFDGTTYFGSYLLNF